MSEISTKEKENTLKLNETVGLICTAIDNDSVGKGLQNEFSRSIVLFSTFGGTVGLKSTILANI